MGTFRSSDFQPSRTSSGFIIFWTSPVQPAFPPNNQPFSPAFLSATSSHPSPARLPLPHRPFPFLFGQGFLGPDPVRRCKERARVKTRARSFVSFWLARSTAAWPTVEHDVSAVQLGGGFDQSQVAIVTAINHGASTGLGTGEQKEIVLQQVHFERSILHT
jgi:hypothetical protein